MLRSLLVSASLACAAVAQNAKLTVIHGIPGLPAPVEVFADGSRLFGFDFPEVRGPLSLPPATYAVEVRLNGNPVLAAPITPAAGKNYTAVAHLRVGSGIALSAFENDSTPLRRGYARVIVRHLADAPAVDVLASQRGSTIPLFRNVSNPEQGVIDVPAGTYAVRINAAGTRTTVLGPVDLTLEANKVYSAHAIGKLGEPSFQLSLQSFDLTPAVQLAGLVRGTACGGRIGLSTRTPAFGQPFQVTLSGGTQNGFGLLHTGFSDSRFLVFPLPLDLSRLGFAGCSLYQSTEMIRPVRLDANGGASVDMTIPASMQNSFREVHFQYSFVTTGNRVGLKLTDYASVERR